MIGDRDRVMDDVAIGVRIAGDLVGICRLNG